MLAVALRDGFCVSVGLTKLRSMGLLSEQKCPKGFRRVKFFVCCFGLDFFFWFLFLFFYRMNTQH